MLLNPDLNIPYSEASHVVGHLPREKQQPTFLTPPLTSLHIPTMWRMMPHFLALLGTSLYLMMPQGTLNHFLFPWRLPLCPLPFGGCYPPTLPHQSSHSAPSLYWGCCFGQLAQLRTSLWPPCWGCCSIGPCCVPRSHYGFCCFQRPGQVLTCLACLAEP